MSSGFMFYENFLNAIDTLPEEEKAKACYEFCRYGITGEMPKDKYIAMFCVGVSASVRKYSGRGGARDGAGRKSKESKEDFDLEENQKNQKNHNEQTKTKTQTKTQTETNNIVATCFEEQAERLADIVKGVKNIQINKNKITAWAKSFEQLNRIEGVAIERIGDALDWYADNIGGEYIPVIESGASFREKFTKLENAMNRKQTCKPANDEEEFWERIAREAREYEEEQKNERANKIN